MTREPFGRPSRLRVHGRTDPLGIESAPSFSWSPGVTTQIAYELRVGSRAQAADLWGTGPVRSGRHIAVPYRGAPLRPRQQAWWQVRVWDERGAVGEWSEPGRFEIGLRTEEDWHGAEWIGAPDAATHDWTDAVVDVEFRGADAPDAFLTTLLRAEPIGKTWGEALSWTLGAAPRLRAKLTEPAERGDPEVVLDNLAGVAPGDRIRIGTEQVVVAAVDAQALDTEVLFVLGPDSVYLLTPAPISTGDEARLAGRNIMITGVSDAHGGRIVGFAPPMSTAIGDRITQRRLPVTLTAPLASPHPAGAEAVGLSRFRLLMETLHYAGNTALPAAAARWGEDRYDPQSETNPVASGVRRVLLADVDIVPEVLDEAGWLLPHRLRIVLDGDDVATFLDDIPLDRRTLAGDEIRAHGSVGFGARSAAVVSRLTVRAADGKILDLDLTTGGHPFESGIAGASGLVVGTVNAMLPMADPAPLLRRTVRIDDGVVSRARLAVTAGGQHELTLDGRPLTTPDLVIGSGDAVPRLLPDHTSFDRTVLYDTFDVTNRIRPREKLVLAAELGRGFYGVTTPTEWYWNLANFHGSPRLRAVLIVEFEDGRSQTVVTDATWEATAGPTRFDSVYSGERVDGRVVERLRGWRTMTDTGDCWVPAVPMLPPGSTPTGHHGPLPPSERPDGFVPAVIRAHESEPVVRITELRPVSARRAAPDADVWVVDLGQIVTGFPVLTLTGIRHGSEGLGVRLRGGNDIVGAGTAPDPIAVEHENSFHDSDLQVFQYVLGSGSEQGWTPRLTHWGARYIEVRGLARVLDEVDEQTVLRSIAFEVARSGFGRAASFSTGHPLIDRIVRNLEWSEQNNMLHKPTDTPSREKNGWSGDAMASAESQLITWDSRAFFSKYLRDFIDAQATSGQLPMILPAVRGGYGYDRTPGWEACWAGVPSWDAALFVIAEELYLRTGDDALIKELRPTQERLLAYYTTLFDAADDYRFDAALGEYSAAGAPGSSALISLLFYIHFADVMQRTGPLCGAEDADRWAQLAGQLRRAFVRGWWNDSAQRVADLQVESANVLALEFDAVPGGDLPIDHPLHLAGSATQEANRAAAAAAVVESIAEHGGHLQMGVYGARYAGNVLAEHGYADQFLAAIMVQDAPSFAAQIADGATSLWEMWDGGSKNHHYWSSIATFFYQELAGITPLSPGYTSIRVRPRPPAARLGVDHVNTWIEVAAGTIGVTWTRSDDVLTLTVDVPPNTAAEIWVPDLGRVTPPAEAESFRTCSSGSMPYYVFDALHGRYKFRSERLH